ncbi:MAG TPA: hypothetical protein VJL28_04890 [Gemmatimonadaceae bacterium]|nr:hypothetical protein [Gemmatimonadaceae bacterium]
MNEEHPVDLSALDPTTPPVAFEARVARVRRAADSVLRARREGAFFRREGALLGREGGTALFMVARWRAPLLAAAVLVMLASVAVFRATQAEPVADAEPVDEIADALYLGSPLGEAFLSASLAGTDVLLGGFDQ